VGNLSPCETFEKKTTKNPTVRPIYLGFWGDFTWHELIVSPSPPFAHSERLRPNPSPPFLDPAGKQIKRKRNRKKKTKEKKLNGSGPIPE
jgi:hypothetical protein